MTALYILVFLGAALFFALNARRSAPSRRRRHGDGGSYGGDSGWSDDGHSGSHSDGGGWGGGDGGGDGGGGGGGGD